MVPVPCFAITANAGPFRFPQKSMSVSRLGRTTFAPVFKAADGASTADPAIPMPAPRGARPESSQGSITAGAELFGQQPCSRPLHADNRDRYRDRDHDRKVNLLLNPGQAQPGGLSDERTVDDRFR